MEMYTMNVQTVNMISVCENDYVDAMDMDERLKKARKQAGFTSARQAAARLGLKHSTYAAHENGQNAYDAAQAAEYAKAFKVSASWLLLGDKRDSDEGRCEDENDDFITSEAIDEQATDDQISNLLNRLSPRQKAAFLTMLQSFLSAIGIPEHEVYGSSERIEDSKFLGTIDGHLDRELLEKASAKIRQQERELTSQAIFNSTEYDRRLKIEYNKLYLQLDSNEQPNKKNAKNNR